MKPVFKKPSICEKHIKETLAFPPFIMMENAASALENAVLNEWNKGSYNSVLIISGKGNNGADGLALARKLFGKIPVFVYCPELPQTEEGSVQSLMAKKLKIPFLSYNKLNEILKSKTENIFVDCIFGTGFLGELSKNISELIETINQAKGFKIACDIPSALKFKADVTVTMGTLKSILLSDKAKDFTGKIIVSELGISETIFENKNKTDIFLIEESDIKLPERNNCNSHKGKFGHACIISGEKSGASILSGLSALSFGSGLVSLLDSPSSNLSNFKVPPSIMITKDFPQNATAFQIGSGLGNSNSNEKVISNFCTILKNVKNPSCVIDADMFNYNDIKSFLFELNKINGIKIVLTPHAKELSNLVKLLNLKIQNLSENANPSEVLEYRIEIGKLITKKYRNTVVVMKGSNTFIADKGLTYIINCGSQSLSKGGSGDVLAGMITALLAQGYSAKDAAITSVYRHGMCASEFGKKAYNLTPEKLISLI